MTNHNLEKKCKWAIIRIDKNIDEIKHTLDYIVEFRKDYCAKNCEKCSDYY